MTDDELREQLALYAVGALPDDERREVEAILSSRPDLQVELAEMRAAAATLADAVAEAPPAALRARVLDLIAETPQLPAEPAAPAATAGERAVPPDGPIAPVVPIDGHRRRNRILAVGAAAAAVVAILVGLLVASPWSGTEQDQVASVLDADDAQTIAMPGTLPGVTIVHSADRDAAVLQAARIPVPRGDRVYELWRIKDNVAHRYTTFRPEHDGTLRIFAPGLDPASADVWAITEEAAGGSESPTPPILNATA